jgi:hypothetical protein
VTLSPCNQPAIGAGENSHLRKIARARAAEMILSPIKESGQSGRLFLFLAGQWFETGLVIASPIFI